MSVTDEWARWHSVISVVWFNYLFRFILFQNDFSYFSTYNNVSTNTCLSMLSDKIIWQLTNNKTHMMLYDIAYWNIGPCRGIWFMARWVHPRCLVGFVLLDLYFYGYVLLIFVCPFVLFLSAIVLYVLLRYTDSDYPFDIIKLFLLHDVLSNAPRNERDSSS